MARGAAFLTAAAQSPNSHLKRYLEHYATTEKKISSCLFFLPGNTAQKFPKGRSSFPAHIPQPQWDDLTVGENQLKCGFSQAA